MKVKITEDTQLSGLSKGKMVEVIGVMVHGEDGVTYNIFANQYEFSKEDEPFVPLFVEPKSRVYTVDELQDLKLLLSAR